jgi:hypothetical protein
MRMLSLLRLPVGALVVLCITGASVAGAASRQDPGELYVITGRGAPVDISRSSAADVSSSISPGGDRIAFWSDRRHGHEDLYLVGPDGSNLTRVAGNDPRAPDVREVGPTVFADGGTRLYASYIDQTRPLHPTTVALEIDVRSAAAVRLPWCRGTPVPAPTGGLVACPISALDAHFMPTTNTAVWRPRSSGGATRIATLAGAPIAWTPDARDLLVRRTTGLAVVIPGSGLPARTVYRGDVAAVSFPHGSAIVRIQDPSTNRFQVSISGGAVTQLASDTRSTAVVSASGRRAYLRYLPRAVALVVTDSDGRDARVVARYGRETYESLAWFPTGGRLLVSVIAAGPRGG